MEGIMPGFTTHYLFGINAYHHLRRGPLREDISRFHGAYALGEQGPDPFFFSPLALLRKAGSPANYMHNANLGKCLSAMIRRVGALPDGEKRRCRLAYTAGFLGHYLLDAALHPYVYAK